MKYMENIVRVSFGLRNAKQCSMTYIDRTKRYLKNLRLQYVLSKGNLQVLVVVRFWRY